ncbi:hypothetical protein Q7P37_010998 [Cladosporium fusiforme]
MINRIRACGMCMQPCVCVAGIPRSLRAPIGEAERMLFLKQANERNMILTTGQSGRGTGEIGSCSFLPILVTYGMGLDLGRGGQATQGSQASERANSCAHPAFGASEASKVHGDNGSVQLPSSLAHVLRHPCLKGVVGEGVTPSSAGRCHEPVCARIQPASSQHASQQITDGLCQGQTNTQLKTDSQSV